MAYDDNLFLNSRDKKNSAAGSFTDPIARRKKPPTPLYVPPLNFDALPTHPKETFTEIKLSPPRKRAHSVFSAPPSLGELSPPQEEAEVQAPLPDGLPAASSSDAVAEHQQKIEQLKAFFVSLREQIRQFFAKTQRHTATLKEQIQQHEPYVTFMKQCEELKQTLSKGADSMKKKAIHAGAMLRDTAVENTTRRGDTNETFNFFLLNLFRDFKPEESPPEQEKEVRGYQGNEATETCVYNKAATARSPNLFADPYKALEALVKNRLESDPTLFDGDKPLTTELSNYERPTTPRRQNILNQINNYEKAIIEGLRQANNAYTLFQAMEKKLAGYLNTSINSDYLSKKRCITRNDEHEVATLYLQVTNEVDDSIALHLLPKLYELLLRQRRAIENDLLAAEMQSKADLRESVKKRQRSAPSVKPPARSASSPLSTCHPFLSVTRANSMPSINTQEAKQKTSNPYVVNYEGETFTLFPAACFRGTLQRNEKIVKNGQAITSLWHWIKFRRLAWGHNFPQNDGEYFNKSHAVKFLHNYNPVGFLRLTHLHFKNISLLSIQPCALYYCEGDASEQDREAVREDTKILLIKRRYGYFIGFRDKDGCYDEAPIATRIIQQHGSYLSPGSPYKGAGLWPVVDKYLLLKESTNTTPITVQKTLDAFEMHLRPLLAIMCHDIAFQFHALRSRYESAVTQRQQCKKAFRTQAAQHREAYQEDYQNRQRICKDLMAHIHRLMAFYAFSGETLLQYDHMDPSKRHLLAQVRGLYYTMEDHYVKNNAPMDKRHESYVSNKDFLGYYSAVFSNSQTKTHGQAQAKPPLDAKSLKHSLPKGGAQLKQAVKKDTALIAALLQSEAEGPRPSP